MRRSWSCLAASAVLSALASPCAEASDSLLAGVGLEGAPLLRVSELAGEAVVMRKEPSAAERRGVALHLASWEEAGEIYRQRVARRVVSSAQVRALARRLVRGIDDPQQQVATLLRFVRTEIDYLFVHDRTKPYRPDPPAAVLERGWGDCKDKSFLLIDLLAEVGIEARPLLITMAARTLVDPRDPTLSRFDHVMLAMRLGGELTFLDPSQEQGELRWLHPALQDRHALLVGRSSSRLVRTPSHPEEELRELALDLDLDRSGDVQGSARLVLRGAAALAVLDNVASDPREGQLQAALDGVLDRDSLALFTPTGWRRSEGPVPAVEIESEVGLDGILEGESGRVWLRLPPFFETVDPEDLVRGGSGVIPLQLGVSRSVWNVRLPGEGCRNEGGTFRVTNELGSFFQSVSMADRSGHTVRVERTLELRRPRAAPAQRGAVEELVSAARRAPHQPVSLACP